MDFMKYVHCLTIIAIDVVRIGATAWRGGSGRRIVRCLAVGLAGDAARRVAGRGRARGAG